MFDIKQYESWMEGDQRRNLSLLVGRHRKTHLQNQRGQACGRQREVCERICRVAATFSSCSEPNCRCTGCKIQKRSLKLLPRRRQRPKAKAKADAAPVLPSPQPKQHAKGKGKGKGRIEQTAEVPAPDPRRRSHAISISSRSHAEKAKIVNTVMIRRCSRRIRTQKGMVGSQELQEVNPRQTRQED